MTQSWGFLTNHALLLIYVIRHHDSTVREISAGIGVTERATLAILRELDEDGIVTRHRSGRRNTYSVNFESLAAYRREGTASLTPREFIDGLVTTLLAIASSTATGSHARMSWTQERSSRGWATGASSRTTPSSCSRSRSIRGDGP